MTAAAGTERRKGLRRSLGAGRPQVNADTTLSAAPGLLRLKRPQVRSNLSHAKDRHRVLG